MSYDEQYQIEQNLFGDPYPEFDAFLRENIAPNTAGRALDIGCGQGRDVFLLAKYGYEVIGVDSSTVGIEQIHGRASAANLPITGVVADFYTYEPEGVFDAIVLDSILHFGEAERDKELTLLDKLATCVASNGYLFIFIHKSPAKEQELHTWLAQNPAFSLIKDRYLDYTYEEKAIDFRTDFQYYMFILRRTGE
jgi:SAM-dependent methyltransferase